MTPTDSTLMSKECNQIPEVVVNQIRQNEGIMAQLCQRITEFAPQYVVTIARGSSDNAANYAKYLFESQLGWVTASASPSIVTLYQKPLRTQKALVIGFSQSGRSPDICESMQAMREAGGLTVAFVNQVDSPLADIAEIVVPMHAGDELSVAATKSFIANLSALLQLISMLNEDPVLKQALPLLPERLQAALAMDHESVIQLLQARSTLFTIGRGLGYPIAQEMALKLKETAIIHAECYSGADMLHGPIAVVNPNNPVLTFCQQDETLPASLALLETLKQANATNVVMLQNGNPQQSAIASLADVVWQIPEALHPLCDPITAIQAFYPMVEALARGRGFNPDIPPFLNKVTKTL